VIPSPLTIYPAPPLIGGFSGGLIGAQRCLPVLPFVFRSAAFWYKTCCRAHLQLFCPPLLARFLQLLFVHNMHNICIYIYYIYIMQQILYMDVVHSFPLAIKLCSHLIIRGYLLLSKLFSFFFLISPPFDSPLFNSLCMKKRKRNPDRSPWFVAITTLGIRKEIHESWNFVFTIIHSA